MAVLSGEICDITLNACQSVTFNIDSLPFEIASSQPFEGAMYFGFSFIAVMSCWLFSLGLGQILNLIKRS